MVFQDRCALILLSDHSTSADFDRGLIQTLMQWWITQKEPSRRAIIYMHCWYCGYQYQPGKSRLCYDHAFPYLYANTPLVPCCLRCNSQKRNRTPQDYRRFHDNQFWFERVGWTDSPLGQVLREDMAGLRTMLICYLTR